MHILNISAYRFVSLHDLPALRERMLERCTALSLKGTILLAPEGINLFLAGSREAINAFMAWLHEDPRFAGLEAKESHSGEAPFGRLRVRLKKEIITMRMPMIRPEGGRAPAVDASTLKRWLDQGHDDAGREVVLLDTRNDYETDVGKFAQAVDYRLDSFTAFPAAVAADRTRYENKTVVSYCTGGIRCEKAALHMREIGIEHVHQLEGGILKYLELTDGTHWSGDCFVFDGRGAVNADLLPANELPLPSTSQLPLIPGTQLPLPSGERVGVREQVGDESASKLALSDTSASTLSPPQSSPHSSEQQPSMAAPRVPQRGEEANARSASFQRNWKTNA